MSNLKILVISNYSGLNSSRPEAELMLGLKSKGANITIMTPKTAEYTPVFLDAGIRVIDFLAEKKLDKTEINFIRKELIEGEYDIVHIFYGKAIINGLKAAKGLNVKVVLYRGYCGNIHWWDPFSYFKYLNKRADAVWCIAPAVADLINRNKLFGKKNAFCISKGHNPQWYANIDKVSFEEFNIPENAFVVSMVANARPMKGLKYLIRATHYIDKHISFYLLLIGNGLLSGNIKKIVKKSPLKDNIIFTGYRSDSLGLVKNSSLFVLSSIYGEAICKSVIEAMSLSVAPVITDIPGNRGLVMDGESGLVVPRKNPEAIANAINYMYRNDDKRKLMAEAAKKRMEREYNIEDTIEKILSFYKKLAEK